MTGVYDWECFTYFFMKMFNVLLDGVDQLSLILLDGTTDLEDTNQKPARETKNICIPSVARKVH